MIFGHDAQRQLQLCKFATGASSRRCEHYAMFMTEYAKARSLVGVKLFVVAREKVLGLHDGDGCSSEMRSLLSVLASESP